MMIDAETMRASSKVVPLLHPTKAHVQSVANKHFDYCNYANVCNRHKKPSIYGVVVPAFTLAELNGFLAEVGADLNTVTVEPDLDDCLTEINFQQEECP